MSHPIAEALELYVIGAHDQVPVPEIEAHLRGCDACTAEVRRQAQVDLAMAEVAAEAAFCPGCGAVLTGASCAHCGAVAAAGGFRVERVLVQNAHGRMYLARDAHGNPVALKELAFVQAPHPDAVDAFEREARLLRQLSHPQIPRFVAAFREGEGVHTRLYLAQEYVEGESLQERLLQHQFSEAEARDVAEQVLSILAYLQSLSPMVFHRDIKPANLIRRADGRIALVDFGAARDLGPTVGATLVGTFGYMPVEQMGGIVDASTDLYALGTTLCHLLSRKEPWKFIEDPKALERLNVSRSLRAYLGKLTARQREERYRSAAAASRGLREPPRRRPLPGTWPVRAVVVGGLIAMVTMGMATLVISGSRPRRAEITQQGASEARAPVRLTEPPPQRSSADDHRVWVLICMLADGTVSAVTGVDGRPSSLTPAIIEKIKTWRYPPKIVDGQAVPDCRKVRIDFPKGTLAQ